MEKNINECREHSGCVARIGNLESQQEKDMRRLIACETRVDGIMARLNVLLGGVVVACIMLAINLIVNHNP